mmetsp:Transcript_24987/g.80746  ORF Transcript_24987/g.80746 Transcript_24987/m.80746 type:complete len:203 (+) Transcript_24987:3010-3618(+)
MLRSSTCRGCPRHPTCSAEARRSAHAPRTCSAVCDPTSPPAAPARPSRTRQTADQVATPLHRATTRAVARPSSTGPCCATDTPSPGSTARGIPSRQISPTYPLQPPMPPRPHLEQPREELPKPPRRSRRAPAQPARCLHCHARRSRHCSRLTAHPRAGRCKFGVPACWPPCPSDGCGSYGRWGPPPATPSARCRPRAGRRLI